MGSPNTHVVGIRDANKRAIRVERDGQRLVLGRGAEERHRAYRLMVGACDEDNGLIREREPFDVLQRVGAVATHKVGDRDDVVAPMSKLLTPSGSSVARFP